FPMTEEELPLANLAGGVFDPLDEIGSGPTLGAAPLIVGLGTSVLFDGAQTLRAAGNPFTVNWGGSGEMLGTIEVMFALEDLPSSSLRFLATLWTPDTTTEDYAWFEIDSAGEIVWRR